MASLQNADRYSSTLASGYTAGGTTIVVTSAGGGASLLPTSGDYYLLVRAESTNTEEVFLVTSRSGATLTVQGAQAATTASDHTSGAIIVGTILTAGAISRIGLMLAGTYASVPSAATVGTGVSYKPVDAPYDIMISNGTTWDHYYRGRKLTLPVLANFTWVNQDTATATASTGAIWLYGSGKGSGGPYGHALLQYAPATPYTLTVGYIPMTSNKQWHTFGMCLRDNGSTKCIVNEVLGATGVFAHRVTKYNSLTSYSGDYVTAGFIGSNIWVRFTDDGTNRTYSMSKDGSNFIQYYSSVVDWALVDQIGVYLSDENATAPNLPTGGLWLDWELVGGATPGGAPLFSPHTMTNDTTPSPFVTSSSTFNTGNNPYKAFNGADASAQCWIGTNAGTDWLQIDIGSGNTKTPTAYAIKGDTDSFPTRQVKNFTLQGSNNGSSWTTLDTQTNQTSWSTGQKRQFTVTGSAAYRYFRLNITANNGDATYTEVGELYLYGS